MSNVTRASNLLNELTGKTLPAARNIRIATRYIGYTPASRLSDEEIAGEFLLKLLQHLKDTTFTGEHEKLMLNQDKVAQSIAHRDFD